ncbi:stage V sporulation protein R [Sporanaerobium hydrogeniformans]|uniref:Stage V sporulation protein R n=1 Tax=Sporanaerobium hydrogeniformans TaxID=3072179 RepID=A0AC61DG07_9FIRM|nr:SpoVR family protein [Sporanaerobium hydrogeniformans]PHV71825.1 stage V sporulation protein R [Sporanaerobium hydrogeniformans]
MNYTLKELEAYNEKIEDLAKEMGLDYYPQEFEIISFEDMLCYEAYVGMPSHYPHWSYGKNYDRLKTTYKYNLSGLPYEMVINSNPCIAYLMKDNTLLLQVLTIAHVYGHNDFFKNNRLFKEYTDAALTIEMFKNHGTRIRTYIQDPSIGYEKVERVLDAAHSIKYQCGAFCKPSYEVTQKIEYPQENVLYFLSQYGNLEDWEKDIIAIVMKESRYFIPQIETKIMNEGWATFWHYTLLNKLGLPQGMQVEFFKVHNNVICQRPGSLNPYFIGFKIWQRLYERFDGDFKEMARIRGCERDSSFIRSYLDYTLCEESHLCEIQEEERYYVVSEVANEKGWQNIRNTLAENVGLGSLPTIYVEDVVKNENCLVLGHFYDGRELNLAYTTETLKYIQTLWGGKVILKTHLAKISRKIICSEDKKVTIENV